MVRVDLGALGNQPLRIRSINFGAVGGGAAFDKILLGRTEADLALSREGVGSLFRPRVFPLWLRRRPKKTPDPFATLVPSLGRVPPNREPAWVWVAASVVLPSRRVVYSNLSGGGCWPPLTASVPRDSGRFSTLCEEEKTMGKGNHSQKNDKKNKKAKKGDKEQDPKSTAKKR